MATKEEKRREYKREWRAKNREKDRATKKLWKEKNKDKARAYKRADREKDLKRAKEYYFRAGRDRYRQRQYNLSQDQWNKLFAVQDFKCAVCRTDKPTGKLGWMTDHDHMTGHVRGILCSHCNTMLGFAKDSATTMRLAIEYLESPEW